MNNLLLHFENIHGKKNAAVKDIINVHKKHKYFSFSQ